MSAASNVSLTLDTDNVRLLMIAYEEAVMAMHGLFADLYRSSAFALASREKRAAYEEAKLRKQRLQAAISMALRGATANLTEADAAFVAEIDQPLADDDVITITEATAILDENPDDARHAERFASFSEELARAAMDQLAHSA